MFLKPKLKMQNSNFIRIWMFEIKLFLEPVHNFLTLFLEMIDFRFIYMNWTTT